METSRYLSVGDVIDKLLSDQLIDSCHMTSEHITVVQGTKRHSFPIDKAHTFLLGMLRGRSWNADAGGDGAVASLRAVNKFPDPQTGDSERGASTTRAADRGFETTASLGSDSVHGAPVPRPFDSALDELAAIAGDMDLVEECERMDSGGIYRIKLSSCETEMRPEEAITYLAECVLHRLKTMRRETTTES